MKNTMTDVRNHLVAMMEELGDVTDDVDTTARTVERARAMAGVADKYIASVKVEIDARRMLAESGGDLPRVLESPNPPALPADPLRGRAFRREPVPNCPQPEKDTP